MSCVTFNFEMNGFIKQLFDINAANVFSKIFGIFNKPEANVLQNVKVVSDYIIWQFNNIEVMSHANFFNFR